MGLETGQASARKVLRTVAYVMLPAAALPVLIQLLFAAAGFPLSALDLTGPLALAAYWLAESGGPVSTPVLGVALLLVIVSRAGLTWKQRAVEALIILSVAGLVQGGGAQLNEHIVKPALKIPRPNIVALAEAPPEAPLLGMPVEAFYAMPDKSARSQHLQQILAPVAWLHARVREHWVVESGYSFPSGHAYSAMMLAAFSMALALQRGLRQGLWLIYLTVPWAVLVCLSRPILRVHSVLDIGIGALEGALAGLLGFLLVHALCKKLPWKTPTRVFADK